MAYLLPIKMVQKMSPKNWSEKKGLKNGPKSSPIVQGSKGLFFLTGLSAQRTCAVNLQQSRDLVGVKEFVKSSVLHTMLWFKPVLKCQFTEDISWFTWE